MLQYMVDSLGGERNKHRLSKPIFISTDNSHYNIISC